MYPNEVKITNFTEKANLHRNSNRPVVDQIFAEKQHLQEQLEMFGDKNSPHAKMLQEKIDRLDYKGHQIWREIVTVANSL